MLFFYINPKVVFFIFTFHRLLLWAFFPRHTSDSALNSLLISEMMHLSVLCHILVLLAVYQYVVHFQDFIA
jgi:hypothetical protein